MDDVFSALLGLLSGLFGLLLGMAYFLPVLLLLLAVAAYAYSRRRRARPTVFTAQEPGQRERRWGDRRRER